jgi:heptosyltransferase-2
MTKKSKKILIVGPAWVGDMVMAQSLFIYLKQVHPTCIIDVLAPAWSEPLLALMPEVRQSHVMPLGHGKLGLSERIQLGKSLRSEQYDESITLPNSWKSALVPWAAKVKRRIGYKGEMRYGLLNDIYILDKQILTMTVQRFVALGADKTIKTNISLKDCPQPRLSIDQKRAESTLKQYKLETNKPLLALCAGAEYGSAKCWPAEHYAHLARYFLANGWQVVLLGSEKDRAICHKINSLSSPRACVNLAGKTSLQEAIFILSQANYVVSNDSGLMHIAAAVDRPLIALYGSSDPSFTPPLHQAAQIVYLDLACSPCFKRKCPLGHLDCLQNILPKQLITMIETEKSSDDS